MRIKQHFIELLGILATVFGAFFMNSVILNITSGRSNEGYHIVYIDLMVFCAWYTVVGFVISVAHPNPSKYGLLMLGVIIATVLVLSSQGWIDPNIDFVSKINSWLIGYTNYIFVIPVFFVVGMITEKYVHA
jgi:hypothetical protein